jgi:hypothetical protein
MGTILASAIITSVRRVLLDPSPGVTWLDATLLSMINRAERLMVMVKHDVNPVRDTSLPLVAGYVQTLPANAVGMIQVYANAVGQKRRISQVDAELQDAASIYYPAATQEQEVQHWTTDPRNPNQFEVFPPNSGTGEIDCLYGATPAAIAAVSGPINVNDMYEQVLIDIVCSFAYAEDTTRKDLSKTSYYMDRAMNLLGVSSQSQVAISAQVGTKGPT